MNTTYSGTKFRPTGETYKTVNRNGETVVKEKFIPTSGYMKWLEERRQEQQNEEVQRLQAKLQYEYETYGQVDPIDFSEYQYLMKKYYGITIT